MVWVGPITTFYDLRKEVHKRCEVNGIAPPEDMEMEDQICQGLPAGYCNDTYGFPTTVAGRFAVLAMTFKQGTATLARWWANGRRRVSKDEILRRTYICNACPENRPIEGCTACAMRGVHKIVNEIVAGTELPTDNLLQACGVCSCSLKAKTRIPLEDLKPHIPDSQWKRLPEKCWLRENKE